MNASDLIDLAFSLLGVFAALLWMKPGRSAALRYAFIVLPFAGICYLAYLHPGEYGNSVLRHLPILMPLFVFLLGKYMLRLPWRRVVLSLGVYALVSGLETFADMLFRAEMEAWGWRDVLFGLGFYISTVWAWGFIRLCTRKTADIRTPDRLFTAAALLTVSDSLRRLTDLGKPALQPMVCDLADSSMLWGSLPRLLPMLILLLCFAAGLRYVLLQSWKRAVGTAFAAMATLVGIAFLVFVGQQNRELAQIRLTEHLIDAIEEGNYHEMEQCLRRGADVNIPLPAESNITGEWTYFYPLIHATARNHVTMVRTLLAAGADVGVRRSNGDTALLSACIENNPETVRLLLEAGSDVNAGNHSGYTPLIQSSLSEYSEEVIRMLLQAGAEVNHTDADGCTALHYAALPEESEREAAAGLMRLLLENGAQVNIQDCAGDTPLLQCARDGFIEGVRLLLEHQADASLRDRQGLSPLDHAEQEGHEEIAELLRRAAQGEPLLPALEQ